MYFNEQDTVFENELVLTQHICGLVLLVFNSLIIALIFLDRDLRNKHYRKYLCWIQICSLVFDTLSDFYAPIVMAHLGIMYSDSLMSNVIGLWSFFVNQISPILAISGFQITEFVLLGELLLSYFACVYYRRGIILGPNGRFNVIGWKRSALFLGLHFYALVAVISMIHFSRKTVEVAEEFLPSELHWVRNKTTYLFILPDENWRNALVVIFPISDSIALVVILMLVQLVREVKKMNNWASPTTKIYQRLAVRSLILQGSVPTLLHLIPIYAYTCLQFAPIVFEVGEGYNRFATVLSPILWILLTKHTLKAHWLFCIAPLRIERGLAHLSSRIVIC